MKLSFCPINSFGDFLIVTTAVAIAFSHSVEPLAQATQELTQIILQAPVQHNYSFEQVSGSNLEGSGTDIFHLLSKADVFNNKSDNPPPVPRLPGGSR